MLGKRFITKFIDNNKGLLTLKAFGAILLGTAIGSFGIYNIHQQANITEGGVIGLILLLNNQLGLSPSLLTPILDILCYAIAFRYLGKDFIKVSFISTLSLAGFFRLWEQFPPVLPNLSPYPLVAAIAGGIFVGTGVGLIIRQGGSSGGDDALALIISKFTRCRLSKAYLATDIVVLSLSLLYIPLQRLVYSLVTVVISSLLIESVQKVGRKKEKSAEDYSSEEIPLPDSIEP
ncbi:YitT family protein [Clostridium sp. KNHs205]|jgi:uncharacterized membrane-anchored protein YitT (DUF2179 family)|uniref:YitT family protein n=1 Tax=Clostridium sp. KNHs205 TaxID=1449050 RepID=UPI000691559E|nr:YitT family protein [Clostridium sp. KNHs205]